MTSRCLALTAALVAALFLPVGAHAQFHSPVMFANGAGEECQRGCLEFCYNFCQGLGPDHFQQTVRRGGQG
jgi:hypothetical protein